MVSAAVSSGDSIGVKKKKKKNEAEAEAGSCSFVWFGLKCVSQLVPFTE